MGYDVQNLPVYIQENSKDIVTIAVKQSTSVDHFISMGAFQTGVKGSAHITKMQNAVTFQDASGCGRVSAGTTVFSNRKISVVALRDNTDFCAKDLINSPLEMEIKGFGKDQTAPSVEAAIVADKLQLFGAELENLVWLGDTALTGTNNLKWFNGIVKLLKTEGGTALTLGAGDVITKLQEAVGKTDITERSQADFRVYIGEDTMAELELALYNKNMFNPGSTDVVPGTRAKIQVAPGLNTKKEVVLSRVSNIRIGLDGEGTYDKVHSRVSPDGEFVWMDIEAAIGVQVINPAKSYYASLA